MSRRIVDLERLRWPQSIRGINELETEIKEAIYLSLIPEPVLTRFNIDPYDRERLQIICPYDTRSVEIRLYHEPDAEDPIFYLHMADTLNFQIAILLLVINDPEAPRFNTDVDEHGLPTRFGTLRRNIPEEIRAMEAGLAPGQVRRGLRLSRHAIPTFERFLARTGHDMVIIEPLTYNNAIVYERYGFAYFQGRRRMEWINEVLRPGGAYFERFDGSTPFRKPEAWKSIRGRAWAIHDGILGEPFGDIRMYKRIGHHAGINTFPDGVW
ncbi:MAG TPA: hypothetical protein ENI95_02720 [Chloroflexi bacterium]|nr:hypothetical protein [Chloroflexota bacterium]